MESIKLNKELYSRKAIEKAIKAFKRIGKLQITAEGKYFNIKINSRNDEYKDLPVLNELANYILAESIT